MTTCSNCGTELAGAYCHACGQKRFVEEDRRFAHLLHQFIHSATDVDGRIWRSVRALLFEPGRLSREYIEGRRARWISPASLFFAISVVYFLAPLHGGDLTLQFTQQVPGRIRALAAGPDDNFSPEQLAGIGQAHSALTARWVDARVQRRDAAARNASAGAKGYGYHDYRLAYDAKADDVSKALVILHVPFAALALLAMFAQPRRYFAEHFVVALHFFAFALAALEIVGQIRGLGLVALPAAWRPPEALYDWTMRAVLPGYLLLALRRAYGVGWLHAAAGAAGMLAVVLAVNLYVYRAVQFMVTFALT